MSRYDAPTDQMTMALHKAVSLEIEALAGQTSPACFYRRYKGFYAEQHADVAALELRVRAIAKNEDTVSQVDALRAALGSFEMLHRLASAQGRCLSPAELSPAASGLDIIFGAILKLEIAKRRGANAGS